MVGSLTTGTAARGSESLARLKSALVRQTIVYLAALVAMYLVVAVAVGLFKLQGDALRPVEIAGGLVLLVVGLGLLRDTPLAWRLRRRLSRLAAVALRGSSANADAPLSPSLGRGTASAMGASLAMVCSVAGAPTLSTAMLLPLLVYAGLSEPIWAFLILSAYLVVSAIPFFFVAVGLGEFMLTASARMQGALTTVSAVMLIGLGALLVVSPAAVAGLVASPARLMLLPLRWLL
jgi:cytochrome c biogenesis protein CcdA